MKKLVKIHFVIAVAFFHLSGAYGQHALYSPYTRYGIGELVVDGTGILKAIGNSSTAFRQNNKINFNNPASYSEQDTLSFIFNFDVEISKQNYLTDNNKISYNNFNITGISLSFPIRKGLVFSTGITPYSKVGYNLLYEGTFDNNETYNQYFEGKGGINRLFLGTGLAINKYLSLGLNASYLFGSIYHYRKVFVPPSDGSALTIGKNEIWHSGWLFNTGAQITIPIKSIKFILGTSYELENNAKYERSSYIYSEYIESADSTIYSEFGKIKIPQKLSFGISLITKNLNLYFDYKSQEWSKSTLYDNSKFNDLKIISGGLEFTPVPLKEIKKSSYWERITYRTGFYKKNLYWQINNKNFIENGISFGIGFPWRNERRMLTNTSINITYNYIWRAKIENNAIKENYHLISINLSLYDYWFLKSKYD